MDFSGPAFPGAQPLEADGKWNQTWEPGMSRKDYFAAAALTGMIAACTDENPWPKPSIAAIRSLKYAEAMIKAIDSADTATDSRATEALGEHLGA